MSEISRRAVLSTGGRAAVATLAFGSLAVAAPALGGDDPIYAAMQAHREADAALVASCRRELVIEPEAWAVEQDAYCEAWSDAAWAILDVEPTTVAGALAFLDYLVEVEGWPDSSFVDDAMGLVSSSLKGLLAGGMAS